MNAIKNRVTAAAIQMVSGDDVQANLNKAGDLIAQAVDAGAEILALPEYFCFMGRRDKDKLAIRERPGAGPIQEFLAAQAQRYGIWLVGGSVPLDNDEPDRIFNTTFVFDPDGHCVARYDKIHLFGFTRGEESYDESRSIRPGENSPQRCMTGFGRTGLAICYDLRFPELFRALGEVNLIVLPSAFTYTTGAAHWEILVRARAIENQCYVLAPAQGGKHENGRRTWGHSVLIDPWGDILACIEEGPGFAIGELNLDRLQEVRTSLPALKHRKL